MNDPVNTPDGINRRAALATALVIGGATALSSGCSAQGAAPAQRYTVPIRALLDAIRQGRLSDHLDGLGLPRPSIAGLNDARGTSLLARLKGVPLTLVEGAYLIHPDEQRVDVLLPDARKVTGGLIGAAQFVFVPTGDEVRLATVSFEPAGPAPPATTVVAPGSAAQRVQQMYDALAASGGGTLFFAAGTHHVSLVLTSRAVRIAGAGMGATILTPIAADRPVLEACYNSGSWSLVEIADLSIIGTGAGIGFQAGHLPRKPLDEFAGRTVFRNVRFDRLQTCISRPYGQIGLWLQNCVFGAADYHLHSVGTMTPGEPMHAGNLVARDCHFAGAAKAVFFMNSSAIGTGQITLDHCIMELNPGYVFYINALNGVEGVPGMLVRSCWNEQNATAESVTIDRPQRPVYAYLKDTGLVRFEDTPVGDLRLANATVVTRDCALDLLKSVTADRMSTLVHYDARGFGTFAPKGLVASIAATYQFGPNRALSFAMPPRNWRAVSATDGQTLLSHRDGRIASTGSPAISSAHAEGQKSVSQVVRVAAGEHVQLLPQGDAPRNRWIAWIIDCRLAAGPPVALSVTGTSGVSAGFPIEHTTLRSVAGMTWCDAPVGALHIELAGADTDGSAVEIGRYEMMAFERRQDALAYVNGTARKII
ncbi:hypothetical protein [Sphingomonas fuzhouensis]|uniref:hypothetical protein n=1 Tax=Sphingomonas fuzhouensis TaxID=3106033 RepID=UPI002AFE59B4|nr:hypothetical protein [Sphingomonas sp. SGZ-02]